MKMFKTETHLHVSEVSPCSKICAEEMIKLYKEAGYETVFVTDHFKPVYFDKFGNMNWSDKTSCFFEGYYKACEAGEKFGVNVLMSAELQFVDSPNHYLVYGITKELIDRIPEFVKGTPEEFYEFAKNNGILVIQAHPHRDGCCIPTPECVDGMEIYNSNPRHTDNSHLSEQLVKEKGLYSSAGSDAHRLEDIGKSGITTEKEIKTADDFISVIKSGKFEIIRE